jgi:hypothetical protein
MTRVLVFFAACVAALALVGAAAADPSGPNVQSPVTIYCDNGTSYVVSPGTFTNQSHQAFLVDGTGIFMSTYLAFTDATGTFVLFETSPGLEAQGGLLTCTADLGGGVTLTTRGFITPRT